MARTLTSGQLAKLVHLSPSTLVRYAASGRIPSDRPGGTYYRFDLAEVRAALARGAPELPDPDELLRQAAELARQVKDLTKQAALLTLRVEAYTDIAKKREGAR